MKIQLFIHLFNGTIKKYEVSNDISVKNLIKIIKKKNKIIGDIKIKDGCTILKYKSTLIENNIKNNDNLYLYSIVNGGFIDLLIDLVTGMADLLLNIGTLVEELIRIIVNVIELIPAVFQPDKLINDVIYGSITGITSIFTALFAKIGFIGGDPKTDDGSGGVFGIEDPKKAICIKPTIINLVLLVVCPPLALYIKRGLSSFFLVIICGLMTYYLYYFPGFLFAALHILC